MSQKKSYSKEFKKKVAKTYANMQNPSFRRVANIYKISRTSASSWYKKYKKEIDEEKNTIKSKELKNKYIKHKEKSIEYNKKTDTYTSPFHTLNIGSDGTFEYNIKKMDNVKDKDSVTKVADEIIKQLQAIHKSISNIENAVVHSKEYHKVAFKAIFLDYSFDDFTDRELDVLEKENKELYDLYLLKK